MLRATRRRTRYGTHVCAITAALLLLLSVALLHSRLTSDRPTRRSSTQIDAATFDDPFTDDPLLRDSDSDPRTRSSDDRIDELDVVDEDSSKVSDEEEILRGVESEEEENELSRVSSSTSASSTSSGYYFDHVKGVIRRAFDKRSIDEIDGWDDYSAAFDGGLGSEEDRSKVAFGSDDVPVDEDTRKKVMEVKGVEDALLLKLGSHSSPLREGWGPWFDAKSDFLRKDRMFKSNSEMLNPQSNPLLQDPDGAGVTGLTRGDKVIKKGLLNELKVVPFLLKKPLAASESKSEDVIASDFVQGHSTSNHDGVGTTYTNAKKTSLVKDARGDKEIKLVHRTLGESTVVYSHTRKLLKDGHDSKGERTLNQSRGSGGVVDESSSDKKAKKLPVRGAAHNIQMKHKVSRPIYADGKRWGYFPGLKPHLSFSNFMDAFFRKGNCSMTVFMVWNSPPWMYGVRHQRGLESLHFHHPSACIVVFSETIDLDFFKGFVNEGFKIAVAMPNLEELLEDTPSSVFASVWNEWRMTKFYSTHYSELVRLAALYRYGGIYLDCDVIVLNPLSSLTNSVALEDIPAGSPLNGAVMAFAKNSSFIMQCLLEFYSTYDDTLLRGNGADLLTRVFSNFSSNGNHVSEQRHLTVRNSFAFFPINSNDIIRYLAAPETESERFQQDALYSKILNESYTFHFWNSLTSTLLPEEGSLVARLINRYCIRCSDVM
ncbi:hypothetical protein Dimus_015733 [Dionaea muscipula]